MAVQRTKPLESISKRHIKKRHRKRKRDERMRFVARILFRNECILQVQLGWLWILGGVRVIVYLASLPMLSSVALTLNFVMSFTWHRSWLLYAALLLLSVAAVWALALLPSLFATINAARTICSPLRSFFFGFLLLLYELCAHMTIFHSVCDMHRLVHKVCVHNCIWTYVPRRVCCCRQWLKCRR